MLLSSLLPDFFQRDVTIISSHAGAHEERIEYMGDNGYCQVKPNKKYLFYRWSPIVPDDDKNYKKLKRSVKQFVSSALQNLVNCFPDVVKIAFSTVEWENIDVESQKQLAQILIDEVKREIEIRRAQWCVVFPFNNQQNGLYAEFYRMLTELQTDQHEFGQISCPATSEFFHQFYCMSAGYRKVESMIFVQRFTHQLGLDPFCFHRNYSYNSCVIQRRFAQNRI